MGVRWLIGGVWACVLACSTGCSMLGMGDRELSSTDFVGTGVIASEPTIERGPIPTIQVPAVTREMEAEPGAPEVDEKAVAIAPDAPVLVDELVGEINGKPIFVNDFLESLAGRLRQIPVEWARNHDGASPTPAEWRLQAADHIRQQLLLEVQSELFSAESYRVANIPQQNLQRWLDFMRSREISKFGGSAAATDRSVEQSGLTTDQFLKNLQDETVLKFFQRKVAAGISISPRDIERRYRLDWEKYNPKPVVKFRCIQIDIKESAAIERVMTGIEEGEPFEVLATNEHNLFFAHRGGAGLDKKIDGELVNAQLLADEIVNAALVSLEPGQVAGPIECTTGDVTRVWWVKLESVHQVSQSLYDAQAQIEKELFFEEYDRRMAQEFKRLSDRNGVTPEQIELIGRRLLRVAEERYMDGG